MYSFASIFYRKGRCQVASADQSSIDAIKAVGGTVTVVYMERVALRSHLKPYKYEARSETNRFSHIS